MIIKKKNIFNYSSNLYNYFITTLFNKYKIGNFPSFLSIEISSVCNLKCPECLIGNNTISKRKNKFLSLNKYKYILSLFKGRIINLILYFQGEPFLNPDFIDIIKYTKDNNIFCMTSTNAQNINDKLAEQIVLSNLDHIIISIDGITQSTYEKYRVGGKLSNCINAIKSIDHYKKIYKKKTPKIEAQMIVFSHNENEIPSFKKEAKLWGANKISIKSAQIYNYKKNASLIPSINKYSRYKYINGEWQQKKVLKNKCWRVWNGAVINVDGDLLPCCFDKNSLYSYGNVFSQNIESIWNNDKANAFRKIIMSNRSSIPICTNCE